MKNPQLEAEIMIINAADANLFHGFKILVNSWIKTLTKVGI